MCAVDADNDAVGATITLAEFSSLPYLATSCGHQVSPLEAQLGVARRTEVTTAFGLAPVLLSGSNMVALIHARLARQLAARTNLRLLEPPMPLQSIHQLLLWPASVEHDPAHRWLRTHPGPRRAAGGRPGSTAGLTRFSVGLRRHQWGRDRRGPG